MICERIYKYKNNSYLKRIRWVVWNCAYVEWANSPIYIYREREMILGNVSNLKNIFEKKLGV